MALDAVKGAHADYCNDSRGYVGETSASDRCAISYDTDLSRTEGYRALIGQLRQRHTERMVCDPTSVLCDRECGACPMTLNGKYLHSYGDHISDYSNGLIATQMLPQLTRQAKESAGTSACGWTGWGPAISPLCAPPSSDSTTSNRPAALPQRRVDAVASAV